MKLNWVKIGGIALSIAGAGISLLTNIVDDKKLDEKVANTVADALKKQAEES